MSFEGYYQVICETGHLTGRSLYPEDFEDSDWAEYNSCRICKKPLVWVNLVDETNAHVIGEIDMTPFATGEWTHTFHYGTDNQHSYTDKGLICRIPTPEEWEAARSDIPEDCTCWECHFSNTGAYASNPCDCMNAATPAEGRLAYYTKHGEYPCGSRDQACDCYHCERYTKPHDFDHSDEW